MRIAVLVCALIPLLAAAPSTQPSHTNHLAGEKSPYLLQHAHNPVDWYPWGEEAFARAKRENKPIFLSVGYSTCHWCHVMERESFENEAIAKLLNEGFIAIKVDREERPDVDKLYMTFIQASTGSGGWPMNVFLTPDLKPFFGGTYFPPEDRDGSPGLAQVLIKVRQVWQNEHDKVIDSATKVANFLKQAAKPTSGGAAIDNSVFDDAVTGLKAIFDQKHAGFGGAPKFPEPVYLNFLLRYHAKTGDVAARDMTLDTLRAMAAGGIHDQLGGGFHRYSTDPRWFLPHFEKMLYDQAQLALAYIDAYQLTHDRFFADTARDILDYVLRDLRGVGGQFLSAEDADSAADPAKPTEKGEGAFYVWSEAEIGEVLGDAKQAEIFDFVYGVTPKGNVGVDPRGEFPGKNVLSIAHSVQEAAAKFSLPADQVTEHLSAARAKLLARRQTRPRPSRDDKALAAWNGLALSAFARAGAVLDEPRYTAAASRAAGFLRDHLYDSKTHALKRRFRDGQADVDGFAEDYAFVIQGLVDLYESNFEVEWLNLALALQAKQDELFWDTEGGGYFSTPATDSLLMRFKPDEDNVEPGANSVAALNLLRLAAMTDEAALREHAAKTFAALSGKARQAPESLTQLLVAGLFASEKPLQIVLAAKPGDLALKPLLAEVHGVFHPNRIILFADGGPEQAMLAKHVEFLKELKPLDGKPTAFVCKNFVCQLPTNDPVVLRRLLQPMATSKP